MELLSQSSSSTNCTLTKIAAAGIQCLAAGLTPTSSPNQHSGTDSINHLAFFPVDCDTSLKCHGKCFRWPFKRGKDSYQAERARSAEQARKISPAVQRHLMGEDDPRASTSSQPKRRSIDEHPDPKEAEIFVPPSELPIESMPDQTNTVRGTPLTGQEMYSGLVGNNLTIPKASPPSTPPSSTITATSSTTQRKVQLRSDSEIISAVGDSDVGKFMEAYKKQAD